MNYLSVQAGDVIVTNFDFYQHYSLVSDRLCPLGKNMLISATKRNGTVQEEPWDIVTKGRHTYIAPHSPSKPIAQILSDARSQIGNWKYSVSEKNCEHFVKWCSEFTISSTQVKAGVCGAVLGSLTVAAVSEKPSPLSLLAGAVFAAVIGVSNSKAPMVISSPKP